MNQKGIQKRDNGNYYLPVGNYQVEWSRDEVAQGKHQSIINKTLEIVENTTE